MTKRISFTLTVVIFAVGLLLTTPTHAQQEDIRSVIKDVEMKSGVEIAARVEGLRRDSLNLNAALHQFEKWGRRPKLEDAYSVSGRVDRLTKGAQNERDFAIRNANYAQTIREGSIELVFVPVIDTPTEWQGTMIARLYNAYNELTVEEVFDLVIIQESTGRWSPVYELSFFNGYPYLEYQTGMYASFALGVPIADHPAATGSAPSTYNQPWQRGDVGLPNPCPLGAEGMNPLRPNCGPLPLKPTLFRPISYRVLPQGGQDRFPGRCLNQGSRCNNTIGTINNVDSWLGVMGGRVRQTAHDAFGTCAGAAIISWGSFSRFAAGCGGALINQAGHHIFRIW